MRTLFQIKKFFLLLTVFVIFLNCVLLLWICTYTYTDIMPTTDSKLNYYPIPDLPRRDAFWQPVSGAKYKFFVYSAHLETREIFGVRVIAAVNRQLSEKVYCRLWFIDGRVITLDAVVQILNDNGLLEYSAAYVMCPLTDTGMDTYEAVTSLVAVIGKDARDDTPVTNLLVVRDIVTTNAPQSENLHICVKPFHSMYKQTEWLLEWLLVNTMLGVSHFYMYNQSMSEGTSCLLENFMNNFTILPWQLPIESNLIRAEVAAYHDCLYRSLPDTSWLLIIDVDEVIFPKAKIDLLQLIDSLVIANFPKEPIVSLIFQNAFFYTAWKDDPESPAHLLTSLKTRRLEELYPHYNLSKYIVKPATVLELADHFIYEHRPHPKPLHTVRVSENIALLHHYRDACDTDYQYIDEGEPKIGKQCLELPSLVDRTAHKWTSELREQMHTEKNRIEKVCVTTPAFFSKIKDSFYIVHITKSNVVTTNKGTPTTLPPLPDMEAQDGVWQPVAGIKSVYVYSAYAELRVAALVRVIAVSTTTPPAPMLCRIWLPEGSVFTVQARIEPLRQTFKVYSKYTASFVLCLPRTAFVNIIAKNLEGAVMSVIAKDNATVTTNLLPVLLIKPEKRREKDIVIRACVEPVNKDSQDDWLMEWFEFNRILNVTHFYMYNESMSQRMNQIVTHYKGQGLITERPWRFPINSSESRLISKVAAINDCLYRSMEKTRWMLLLSVDELLVPRQFHTLTEMIRKILTKHRRRTSLLFQNVFFYRDWQDDPEYQKDELMLMTSRKTKRTSKPDPFYQNNRLMILPHKVVQIGTNFVREILPVHKTYGSMAIPTKIALIHNYQQKCYEQSCLHVNTTIDRTANQWKEKLHERIFAEMSRFSSKLNKTTRAKNNNLKSHVRLLKEEERNKNEFIWSNTTAF